MKMLLIHADQFEYEITGKAMRDPEKLRPETSSASLGEVLVCFCTIEHEDEEHTEAISTEASKEINNLIEKLQVNSIVIYPYAHLSSDLAEHKTALSVLTSLEEKLRKSGFQITRSPFGWYKRFLLKCKGHPLAESSRTITVSEETVKPQLETVEYKILTPEGQVHDPEKYKSVDNEFRALVEKEALKKESLGGIPRFLSYCKKFGIAWETFSDIGHMRYGPEASLMFDLIGQYSIDIVRSLNIPVFHVRGSNMFNLAEPPVKEHAKLFGDKLYELKVDNRRLLLRYAACHQQFSSVRDWNISYKHIPFGTFEIADSYRLEKSGELLLCFRVRKLHMPDLHIYCRDTAQAKKMCELIHKKIYKEIRKLGREYVSIYNINRDFFNKNKKLLKNLLEVEGKPVLINFVPKGKYYWVLNIEYNIIDEIGRPREIATVQIDVGNSKRFGIKYTDKKGNEKYPMIIHTALIGTIERYLFTLFDCAVLKEKKGEKPSLPLWISPIQVRIIPVSKDYIDKALEVCQYLEKSCIRVDVDDRDLSISKKVREAETSWIPYIAVLGKKELEEEILSVRRRNEEKTKMSIEKLSREIKDSCKGYPFIHSTIPVKLSNRPIYK